VLRNKTQLRPVKSDLNQVVAETVDSSHWVQDVKLAKVLNPLPNIVADPERLQNVVTNLLLNARDVMGKGGQVRVEISQQNGSAVLAVSGNRCGMSPLFMWDSLFRPFRVTEKEGLGIGLYQARMILEDYRGIVQVESEPGKGTTFRVILSLTIEAS
jgi:signal transduction histidine kinase